MPHQSQGYLEGKLPKKDRIGSTLACNIMFICTFHPLGITSYFLESVKFVIFAR